MQAVLSGGLVFLAVLAERFFDLRLGRWQWFGVTITAAGLAIIGLTGSGAARPQRSSLAALIAVEARCSRSAPPSWRSRRTGASGTGSKGCCSAWLPARCSASPISPSSTSPTREGALHGLLSPWTATALLAGAIAFYASARSLQIGPGVEVIALTSVAANLVAIMGGIVVFGEPIGSGPLAIGARFVGFCLVIAGAALMPVQHAEEREPAQRPRRVGSPGVVAVGSQRRSRVSPRAALVGSVVREPQFDAARPALVHGLSRSASSGSPINRRKPRAALPRADHRGWTGSHMTVAELDTRVQDLVGKTGKLLIDGNWVEARLGQDVRDLRPGDGAEPRLGRPGRGRGHRPRGRRRAPVLRRRALDWRRMTPSERGRIIHRIGDLILEHADELADARDRSTTASRSPIAKAADVPLAADLFHYMSGWATKIEGNTIPISRPHRARVGVPGLHAQEPVGVVGQIIPWNFPLLMAAWKLGPALAAGCTVVLKPAEQTPLSALRLGELMQEAGLPAGRGQHRDRLRRRRRGARRATTTSTRSPSPARPRSAG